MSPKLSEHSAARTQRTYAREEMLLRGELRRMMNGKLASLSGDARATMAWTVKGYCMHVFLRHSLKLVGWPEEIVFENLSRITGKERISRLAWLWLCGTMRFEPVTDTAELAAAAWDPLAVAPAARHRGVPRRRGRSDIGRHRRRPVTNPDNLPLRYRRDGPRSAAEVTEEAEARAEAAAGPGCGMLSEGELRELRLRRRPLVRPEFGCC